MEQQSSSILILKQKAGSLRLAEQFLGNRGWTLYFANSLKGLIINLAQKQPQYLLLPVDFPHKKVMLLPQILAQAFPVKIIVYAENTTSASTAKLQEVKSDYRLYPPVSGPAIERMILKLQKDEEIKAQMAERATQAGSNSAGPTNAESQGTEFEIRFKQEQAEARGRLTALLTDDSDGDGPSGPGFMGHSEAESNQNGPIYHGDSNHNLQGSGPNGAMIPDQGSQTNQTEAGYIPGDFKGPQGSNRINDETDFGGQVPFYGNQDLDFDRHKNNKKTSRVTNSDSPIQDEESVVTRDPLKQGLNKQKQEHEHDYSNSELTQGFQTSSLKAQNKEPIYRFRSSSSAENDTIMVRGTQKALEESTYVSSSSESVTQLKKTSNAACIVVESPKFSGYLVAAMGSDRKIDKNFIEMIRERLFGFLKANGEVLAENEKSMEIKLEEIEFEEWAVEQAEFLRKAIHENTEVAMAFFPSKETTIKLEESVSDKMLQMDISELKEDVAVEFDLYIYLPQNQKYLLYTPEGRPLLGTQRERLIEKGVGKMHLRKESAHGVKKYRAQNFLNDKIAEFKSKKDHKKVS